MTLRKNHRVLSMWEGPSDVRTMPDQGTQRCQDDAGSRNSAMSGRCRIKELSNVRTMPDQGTQRCQDNAGSRNSAISGRYGKDLSRPVAITTTTGEQTLSRRLRENKRCHDHGGTQDSVRTKDALTLSPFLTGSRLHFRYYCWFFTCRATPKVMLLGCALIWEFVVCVLSVHSRQSKPKAVF